MYKHKNKHFKSTMNSKWALLYVFYVCQDDKKSYTVQIKLNWRNKLMLAWSVSSDINGIPDLSYTTTIKGQNINIKDKK